jgi:hypothetical protein
LTPPQHLSIKRPGKADLRPFPSRLRQQFAKSFQGIVLQLRSHTTQLNCARTARLISIALTALLIAGCQSNSDRDLVARDRRMQEDQMWAMQDYLQQYQQLICQFRSENASLRRQLNEERSGTTEGNPQPATRIPVSAPPISPTPNYPNTPPPAVDPKQTPPSNIEMPDVPPLKQGASSSPRSPNHSFAERSRKLDPDRYAQLASYETPSDGAAVPMAHNPSATDPSTMAVSADVLLSGEVLANENGGGPRLMIDVESCDQSGNVARFDGDVSLALLASENGVQHRIARWDFAPADVRAAMDATASKSTMRFRVELPAGTKIDGSTELWAKLAPTDGSRLFSHAKVNLTKPGTFSSRTDKVWASEQSVVPASYVDTSTQSAEAAPTINESEWSTAKPGKPAILPPESDQATGGWKPASEPLPAVVENTKPLAPTRVERPKPIEPAPTTTPSIEVAQKPSWTPDRPGKQPQTTPRPSWSATR